MRAALENFIPEVKPGNQTALNTRAAPFAAYIARMHRSIHKLWGFGALEDWEELSGSSPLNDPNLSTTLEMVLNRDGTVDKVTVVRASGYLPFDAAAIDVAFNAGPYPDPPRAIRSANGKIYVHWQFHRDERQCATSGVDYFILDNPPAGADRRPSRRRRPRRRTRSARRTRTAYGRRARCPAVTAALPPRGNGAPAATNGSPAAAPADRRRRPAPPATLRRQAPPREDAAPRRGGRDGRGARGRGAVAARRLPRRARRPADGRADPAARKVAERWFTALASGDIGGAAALAALPFKTSGKDVTKRGTLVAMLNDLAGEEKAAGAPAIEIYTTAGLRSAIGKLPANVDDGSGAQLYALASRARATR